MRRRTMKWYQVVGYEHTNYFYARSAGEAREAFLDMYPGSRILYIHGYANSHHV